MLCVEDHSYWHIGTAHILQSRVYVTVRYPHIPLSVPYACCSSMWGGLLLKARWVGDIDRLCCMAGEGAAQQAAANAGGVTFIADVGS